MNIKTWKSTSMGGRAHTCRVVVLVNSAVAEKEQSWPPWRRAIFHTTTFSAGTYLALPVATWQSTVVVFNGVGIRRTTFVAESLLLKLVLTVTSYETLEVPISVTLGIIRRGSLTLDVDRYLEHC